MYRLSLSSLGCETKGHEAARFGRRTRQGAGQGGDVARDQEKGDRYGAGSLEDNAGSKVCKRNMPLYVLRVGVVCYDTHLPF